MGTTPKKRKIFTAVAVAFVVAIAFAVAFAILLLCLTMRRGHSRGCEGGGGFPPSIAVLLPIVGGVD